MFEPVEEALDEIALLVEFGVVGSLDLAVALGRDHHPGAGPGESVAQMVGIIAFVGDGGVGLDALDELVGEGDVVALAGRADEADGIAQGIAGGMDLGAQAAAGAAQALGIRPPFIRRAPAAC